MVLRLLFLLLVTLNVAVAAWLVLERAVLSAHPAVTTGTPQLLLLSAPMEAPALPASAPAGQALAEVTDAPEPRAVPASYSCLALGPFSTPQTLREARRSLAATAVRSRQRQQPSQRSLGWWVYLPAHARREQALAQAHRLAAKNVRDYFVVSSGEQPNSISLGLFKDPANARKRRDEVIAAGFPARMSERIERLPAYWLEVVFADAHRARWRGSVDALGVSARRTGCF